MKLSKNDNQEVLPTMNETLKEACGYAVRVLNHGDACLKECYQLRHRYFVEERGWVGRDESNPGLETDRYDLHAIHLACFDDLGVAAYLRALAYEPDVGFMLDREFACLLGEVGSETLQREGALELSRLALRPDIALRRRYGTSHPVEEVLRKLYSISIERGYGSFHIVVETGWIGMFERRFGLPFRVLGQPKVFPDGTKTVLATATLGELEDGVRRLDTEHYHWYRGKV